MPSLEQAIDQPEGRALRLYAGVVVFLAGVMFVAVGLFSVIHAAIAARTGTTEAALWAATATGVVIPFVLAVVTLWFAGRAAVHEVGLGGGLAVAGVVLLWLGGPSEWSGALTATLVGTSIIYAVGIGRLLVSFVAAGLERTTPSRTGTTTATVSRQRMTRREPSGRAAVGDGGDDDTDLTYLLDMDDGDDNGR
jgi:hypothetical protein